MGYASRWLRRAALLGLLLSLLTQSVRAEGLHILLVNADPQLSHAARAAFSSSAELHIAQDGRLQAIRESDAQSERARELARTEDADIVAWWTGSELHTYDARTDRLLGTRRAPSLPVSSASAAALVLSIKALLQAELGQPATTVQPANDPPVEAPALPPDSKTSLSDSQSIAADATSGEPRRSVPPTAASATGPDSMAEPAAAQPRLVVALQTGLASLERDPIALFGLSAAGWLDASPLGIALRVESGPQAKLHTSQIDARLLDASLAADFVLRAPTWLALRIWGGIGPSLHLTRLDGTVGVNIDTKRIIPGIGGIVHIECDLSDRWFIGAWASAGWLLVTQRYYVDNILVHESSRPRAAFGIASGVGFDRK